MIFIWYSFLKLVVKCYEQLGLSVSSVDPKELHNRQADGTQAINDSEVDY